VKPVRFHPAAETEMNAAAAYYEDQQKNLGKRFLASVQDALNRIRVNPLMYRPVEPGVRVAWFEHSRTAFCFVSRMDKWWSSRSCICTESRGTGTRELDPAMLKKSIELAPAGLSSGDTIALISTHGLAVRKMGGVWGVWGHRSLQEYGNTIRRKEDTGGAVNDYQESSQSSG